MRERLRNFERVYEFFLLTQKRIERFNESRFKSRKVKGRATSSENRKFFVAVMEGTFWRAQNVPSITATKNFLFSLEVALPFTFLLLKRLSLNLSILFCVSKKNSYTLSKFLNLSLIG